MPSAGMKHVIEVFLEMRSPKMSNTRQQLSAEIRGKREGAIHQFGKARNATTTYTRMDATHLKNSRCD